MNAKLWTPVPVDETFKTDPRTWLAGRARDYGLAFLLAHADDALTWGTLEKDGLVLSTDSTAFPTGNGLRANTLQQARLFGPEGELLVWRTDTGFSARRIADGLALPQDALEETCWLWGTVAESRGGFALMNEGQQGLRHAPPVKEPPGARIGLIVRHYIDYDDQGQARIALSRLVNLKRVE